MYARRYGNDTELTEGESYLVTACNSAMKKPVTELEIEDIRILIGQSINLDELIPPAIKILNENILAEGDFYPGDLLCAVLGSDPDYWKRNPANWHTIVELYTTHELLFNSKPLYDTIKRSFENFRKLVDSDRE